MARPITWQDVSAPRFGASIEAFGDAGDRLAEAVGGIGETALDWRNTNIKEATEQAVANISNSDDPLATANAVPEDWTIDPLAVAVAANARASQLKAKEATQLTIDSQRATLKDIEDRRLSEAIIQRNWEASVKAGRPVFTDADANLGQASVYAGKEMADRLNKMRDDKRAEESHNLRARESRARMQLLDKELAIQNYYSWARERGASPEAQAMEPELLDRELIAEAKRRPGVPITAVDQAKTFFMSGVENNSATPAELLQQAPGSNHTYKDAERILATAAEYGHSQKAAILAAPYDPSNPTKPDPTRPSLLQLQEVAERGPGFADGPIGMVAVELAKMADVSKEEAEERLAGMKAKYRHLNYAQAADLVLQSIDRWDFTYLNSPEVKSGALIYKEVDRLGGKEGIARLGNEATADVDRVLAEIPTVARQVSGAARGGFALPKKVLTFESVLASARAKEKQNEADEAARAAKILQVRPSTFPTF